MDLLLSMIKHFHLQIN